MQGVISTRRGTSWRASVTAALVSALIVAFLVVGGQAGSADLLLPIRLFFVALAFAMTLYILRSGRIHTARLLMFVTMGLFFGIFFEISHEVNRGSILLSEQTAVAGQVPICPITVGFVVPPLLLRGAMIFPATVAALLVVVSMWGGFALLFGRAWCSWVCFFGGLDQLFASLGPTRKGGRPLVEIPEGWTRYARLFPYALLLFLILIALSTLEPFFCAWLCPLRLAYDPPMVTTAVRWLSAIVIVTLGMGLLVVGPFLTKKRLFCSYGCPLLPLNALAGMLSPFRVKVDRERCTDCGLCVRTCPHSAITAESVAKGGTTLECTRCGKCLDKCPKRAIDYRLVVSNAPARAAFVALAVAFLTMFVSSYVLALVTYAQTGVIPKIGGA
ncbi:MAG: 4Fe-4S binding protein [Chloroflexota bacterium]